MKSLSKSQALESAAPEGARHPSFREAFLFWLKLGFISFGGPTGQIAVMHAELVKKRNGSARRDSFMHSTTACSCPAPRLNNWRLMSAGSSTRLGVASCRGFLCYPVNFYPLTFSYIYVAFGNLHWIAAIFYGLKPAVLAIVAAAVIRIGSRALKNEVMWTLAAAAFIAIFFGHVPFPFIIIGAALIGFFGGKWQRDKFFVIRGHGKSSAESVLDDASAVPDHAKPSWPRALRFALVWLISWSAPVLLLSLWLGSGHTVVQEGHPKIVAAMNPCWIAGDACCIPPKAETITTAIGTLLIKFVPTAAPTIPTITAPKLESPERWISPVSSIARTTINIPAIKPKMGQEDPEETTDAETSTGREGIAK
jgi:chromate transport protein ChrA